MTVRDAGPLGWWSFDISPILDRKWGNSTNLDYLNHILSLFRNNSEQIFLSRVFLCHMLDYSKPISVTKSEQFFTLYKDAGNVSLCL